MAPMGSRKRVKPSPSDSQPNSTSSSDDLAPEAGRNHPTSQKRGGGANWYPGAWPAISRVSKAAPVTEVARESISAPKNVASNVPPSSTSPLESPKQNLHPSLQLTRKQGVLARSLPANATTTCINIASDGSASTPAAPSTQDTDPCAPLIGNNDSKDTAPADGVDEPAEEHTNTSCVADKKIANTDGESAQPENTLIPSNDYGGWFSWFYRPAAPEKSTSSGQAEAETPDQPSAEDYTPKEADSVQDTTPPEVQEQEQNSIGNHPRSQKRSWFQMWSGSSEPSKGKEDPKPDPQPLPTEVHEPARETIDTEPVATQQEMETGGMNDVSKTLPGNNRSSGWSFWSRDTSKDATGGKTQEIQTAEAQIAQLPSPKQVKNDPGAAPKVEVTKKGSMKIKKPKENAETATIAEESVPVPQSHPNSSSTPSKASEATASKQLQKVLPNQVLPRFKDTFATQEPPSLLQTIGRYLHYSKDPEHNHVYKVKETHRIHKALAIGVHGYFPAPLIRSVLGQPTGTSIKFSNMAANSIRKWTEDHGYTCDIEKIALEGEGRIAERVDLLWKLLLNWMEEIRKADFILVACHSQGVPVAIMLVAKLISFGCLNAARVGICAMAGVNLGPFPDYKSRWISGSAGELFEFALPYSQVSNDYEAALESALNFGVRITYVGSIDDQLVSLESSLFSPVTHPHIYRAVFVDGRVHAPSFLSHLVGFTLKLRNLGISDHGLIRELSSPLAGSLYTGEGHSRLYDDENVYYLAIEFALETSTVRDAKLHIKRPNLSPTPNPYILPFAMRGILEEEYVRRELFNETMELLKQFDDWRPSSKVLRDVKFRLEGIRSKL